MQYTYCSQNNVGQKILKYLKCRLLTAGDIAIHCCLLKILQYNTLMAPDIAINILIAADIAIQYFALSTLFSFMDL
jgi:hypothetical protein